MENERIDNQSGVNKMQDHEISLNYVFDESI
jgi:hypothetical protein